ncbi:MAG TPA: EamA family transporter [Methylomirabilota bacterium]
MSLSPQELALASALCSAVATILIQRGLRTSNFFAGFWINVVVGTIGLWSAVALFVPAAEYGWRAVPYFVLSGVVGTAAGRLFRVLAIEKVGASVTASISNLTPLIATGLAIVLLGEQVTLPILMGTLVIVAGTVLLSMSGRYVGFHPRHLVHPILSASCFGVVQVIRKIGLVHAGPLFGAAINMTTALGVSTTFVAATGNLDALRCNRRSLLYFVAGGIAENSGVLLLLVALGFGDVSVVIPLSGTTPLFVLLLAYVFPSGLERLNWRLIAGAVLVVIGVFLLKGFTMR